MRWQRWGGSVLVGAMTFYYRQLGPERDLAPLIDAYWVNESGLPETPQGATSCDRVLPDGCIDLVFVNHGSGTQRSRLFTSALIERPTMLDPTSASWFVGVRLRPAMSQVVLPVSPIECRDRDIDAREIDGHFSVIEEQLLACRTPSEALAALRGHVDRRARANTHRAPPTRVRFALKLLANGPPWMSPGEVARALGISPRSLHRDLLSWSGHAPKVLARILRMQHALERLRAGRSRLAEVAQDSGFADQPHMTRELWRLTGLRPSELSR
jgi:AraC-like DNA-binding protein